jgi:hypothetical protein
MKEDTMKNSQIKTLEPVAKVPKAEVIEQLQRRMADLKAQLEAAKALLQAAVSPGKYALNFQVNGLKKELHACKLQIERIRKDPKAEVAWPDRISA